MLGLKTCVCIDIVSESTSGPACTVPQHEHHVERSVLESCVPQQDFVPTWCDIALCTSVLRIDSVSVRGYRSFVLNQTKVVKIRTNAVPLDNITRRFPSKDFGTRSKFKR